MPDHEPLTPADRACEHSLGQLRPRVALDRDRLIYEVGKVCGRRQLQLWRGLTAVLGGVLLVSFIHGPRGPESLPAGRSAAFAPPPGEVLSLRQVPQVVEYFDAQQRTPVRVVVPMEIVCAPVHSQE